MFTSFTHLRVVTSKALKQNRHQAKSTKATPETLDTNFPFQIWDDRTPNLYKPLGFLGTVKRLPVSTLQEQSKGISLQKKPKTISFLAITFWTFLWLSNGSHAL